MIPSPLPISSICRKDVTQTSLLHCSWVCNKSFENLHWLKCAGKWPLRTVSFACFLQKAHCPHRAMFVIGLEDSGGLFPSSNETPWESYFQERTEPKTIGKIPGSFALRLWKPCFSSVSPSAFVHVSKKKGHGCLWVPLDWDWCWGMVCGYQTSLSWGYRPKFSVVGGRCGQCPSKNCRSHPKQGEGSGTFDCC